MIEIDLVRHVKVDGKPALYGCTDVAPIASQNTALLECLVAQQQTNKAYQSIVCSPLMRCQRLAKEFSSRCKLPLVLSLDLQEMNFGCYDGIPFDDLYFDNSSVKNEQHGEENTKLRWSQLEAFFKTPAEIVLPEAEALPDFHHRVIQAWQKLIEQQVGIATKQKESLQLAQGQAQKESHSCSQKSRRVLVLAHGGVIRMILAHVLQLDWQQASWHQKLQIGNGSLSRIIISQSYQEQQLNQTHNQTQHKQQLHQQVTTIAMPLLEEI